MRTQLALIPIVLALGAISCTALAADQTPAQLDDRFARTIKPFLQTYCVTCHGKDKPEAEFDLSAYSSLAAVVKDLRRSGKLLERLQAQEMPPEKAKLQPAPDGRREVIDWFQAVRDYETQHHAGDPGIVLARRLSNAELNYTIRDLTGVDIEPAREFPLDPSNTAGFDNSGESLAMSPALLKKYMKAAREVASHMLLKPQAFAFAPHPMLVETDRDKYCVMQIIDFYHRQNIDYADYFLAAWSFKHRAALGKPEQVLADFAAAGNVSPTYLATIWTTLEEMKEEIGPLAKLQSMWRELPTPDGKQPDAAQKGCLVMRDFVIQVRKKVETRFLNIEAGRVAASSQPMLIWKNRQYATHRRKFDPAQLQVEGEPLYVPDDKPELGSTGAFGPGKTSLVRNEAGDPDLAVPAGQRAAYEAAWGRFCSVFPDMFYKEERGRNYFDTTKDRGRYLSAGFHNVMGYYRDDWPLYELLLDDKQQQELDEMWHELDFVASANIRTYMQFALSGRQARALAEEAQSGVVQAEDNTVTSEESIKQLENSFQDSARGSDEVGLQAIKDYFQEANDGIRWVENARVAAEPIHLDGLVEFAGRAYRRPLTSDEKDELLTYYRACREKHRMDHEAAVRESLVSILMSPYLCYRVDLIEGDAGIHRLTDYDLASRLSYFLWSSMPDKELLAHAAAGDLHEPEVITAQARRMLNDPRARALAVEFGGNWLDFRRFEELNTVDRERFASFTDELRAAMFEEPVRFLMDVFQKNRPITDLLYAKDTFVNQVLAKHYGMPELKVGAHEWVRIDNADRFGRGALLPMAAFLTKNAPGLRTSPVKRGYWVVKNVLGEQIPPPPPVVPELPRDEAKIDLPLRDVLAQHRSDENCAACHARFDSLGLVFEGYGPIGERREKDLADRSVDDSATFPGGSEGHGIEGLRRYIRDRRQNDFVDNFCGKLLVFALGRSLIPSDDLLIEEMHSKLAADGFRFNNVIESIVTSRQFLTKRGREDVAEK